MTNDGVQVQQHRANEEDDLLAQVFSGGNIHLSPTRVTTNSSTSSIHTSTSSVRVETTTTLKDEGASVKLEEKHRHLEHQQSTDSSSSGSSSTSSDSSEEASTITGHHTITRHEDENEGNHQQMMNGHHHHREDEAVHSDESGLQLDHANVVRELQQRHAAVHDEHESEQVDDHVEIMPVRQIFYGFDSRSQIRNVAVVNPNQDDMMQQLSEAVRNRTAAAAVENAAVTRHTRSGDDVSSLSDSLQGYDAVEATNLKKWSNNQATEGEQYSDISEEAEQDDHAEGGFGTIEYAPHRESVENVSDIGDSVSVTEMRHHKEHEGGGEHHRMNEPLMPVPQTRSRQHSDVEQPVGQGRAVADHFDDHDMHQHKQVVVQHVTRDIDYASNRPPPVKIDDYPNGSVKELRSMFSSSSAVSSRPLVRRTQRPPPDAHAAEALSFKLPPNVRQISIEAIDHNTHIQPIPVTPVSTKPVDHFDALQNRAFFDTHHSQQVKIEHHHLDDHHQHHVKKVEHHQLDDHHRLGHPVSKDHEVHHHHHHHHHHQHIPEPKTEIVHLKHVGEHHHDQHHHTHHPEHIQSYTENVRLKHVHLDDHHRHDVHHHIGPDVEIVKDVRSFVKSYSQHTGAPSTKANFTVAKKQPVVTRRDSHVSVSLPLHSHGTSLGPFEAPPSLLLSPTSEEGEQHRDLSSPVHPASPRDAGHLETEVKVRAHMLVITDKTPVRERMTAFENNARPVTRNFVVGRPRRLPEAIASPTVVDDHSHQQHQQMNRIKATF